MRTRLLLRGALLKLLRTTPLHAVSIRELCQQAGVNRTTFYHHYGSAYDLLRDASQQFLDEVAAHLDSADVADRQSIRSRVARVLTYMEENRELAVLLMNNNVDPGFADRLFSLPRITDLLDAALVNCPDEAVRQATVSFVIHGSYRLLQEWINQEERIGPQAEAELILGLAHRVCHGGG
jgi:AcrR family transcriptional regulator